MVLLLELVGVLDMHVHVCVCVRVRVCVCACVDACVSMHIKQ